MLKKTTSLLMIAIFLLSSSFSSFADSKAFAIKNNQNGSISVQAKKSLDKKTKVMIEKDGQKYSYILRSSEDLPLQFGNGEYKVTIMENVEGNQYKLIDSQSVELELGNENEVYLNSIQLIDWSKDMASIKKAKELAKSVSSDMEKVQLVHDYIVNNVRYDYDKAQNVKPGYLPSIDETMSSSKGICYDFASLNASMLRSLDIPTKLVMGYKSDIGSYHAWNEAYVDGEWVIIDATYDSILDENELPYEMVKKASEYRAEKFY